MNLPALMDGASDPAVRIGVTEHRSHHASATDWSVTNKLELVNEFASIGLLI